MLSWAQLGTLMRGKSICFGLLALILPAGIVSLCFEVSDAQCLSLYGCKTNHEGLLLVGGQYLVLLTLFLLTT